MTSFAVSSSSIGVAEAVAAGYIAALQVFVPAGGVISDARVWLYEFGVTAPRADMAEWADLRLARLYEHGPEPDGWGIHPMPDGSMPDGSMPDGSMPDGSTGSTLYQLLVRETALPPID